MLQQLDIQRGLFADKYQNFTIDDQQVIYLLQENTTAITRGVAVIVGDTGKPSVGQPSFVHLANELNKIGWVTILLTAPQTGFEPAAEPLAQNDTDTSTAVAATPTNAEPSAADTNSPALPTAVALDSNKTPVSGIDEQAFMQHEQQLTALLSQAANKAQDYPGFFLVISKGTSAAWLSKIYAEKNLETPDAFVSISPFWPDRKWNRKLPAWLATTSMPVLDMYNQRDNEWARSTVDQRKIAAVKSLKLQYRQRELLGMHTPPNMGHYLGKEIYGWLSHMGW